MEPVQPGRHRTRNRTLAALGLIALPLVGSALVLPTVASASGAEKEVAQRAALYTGADATEVGAVVADIAVTDETLKVDAFFAAGYSYDDAVLLAERWGVADAFQAKVKAGAYLTQGIALADSPYADPTADDGLGEDALVDVFFAFGYTDTDVAVLAEEWSVGTREAKLKAGSELKTVGVLPFVDVATSSGGAQDEAWVGAFFDAGYDYDDAVVLAELWGLGEPYEAKLKAGSLLAAGEPLPETPGLAAS